MQKYDVVVAFRLGSSCFTDDTDRLDYLNEGLESRHTSEEQTLEEICAQGFYLLIVNVLLKS
jgi:hypothetical protein